MEPQLTQSKEDLPKIENQLEKVEKERKTT